MDSVIGRRRIRVPEITRLPIGNDGAKAYIAMIKALQDTFPDGSCDGRLIVKAVQVLLEQVTEQLEKGDSE